MEIVPLIFFIDVLAVLLTGAILWSIRAPRPAQYVSLPWFRGLLLVGIGTLLFALMLVLTPRMFHHSPLWWLGLAAFLATLGGVVMMFPGSSRLSLSANWPILRFFVILLLALIAYNNHSKALDEAIDRFLRNVTEIRVGPVAVASATIEDKGRPPVHVTSQFRVLQTHTNTGQITVRKLQFSDAGEAGQEYIEIQANDTLDLRYGFVADAKRLYGQSSSNRVKTPEKKPAGSSFLQWDPIYYYERDSIRFSHEHKASDLLLLDFADPDLKLEKGDILRIYTQYGDSAALVPIRRGAEAGEYKRAAVGGFRYFKDGSEPTTKTGVKGHAELASLTFRGCEGDTSWLIGSGHEDDDPSPPKWWFHIENKAIWKSDYYETDRVVFGDSNGKILVDFTYTLVLPDGLTHPDGTDEARSRE